jgi:hypothetical protein
MNEALRVAEFYSHNVDALVNGVESLRRLAPVSSLLALGEEVELGHWDQEAQRLRQGVREIEERVAACKQRVRESQAKFVQADRLHRIVSMYLDPAADHAALAARVAAESPALEKSKAFRMVREKVLAKTESTDAHSSSLLLSSKVAATLQELQEDFQKDQELNGVVSLFGLVVVGTVDKCASITKSEESLSVTEKVQVLEGVFLLLTNRFSREADIPLYTALHYNSLVLLERLALKFGPQALGNVLGEEAEGRLASGIGRIETELESHMTEMRLQLGVSEKELGRRQTQCVKRCAHILNLARRAWTGVLDPDELVRIVMRLGGSVLEWLVSNVIELGDLGVAESAALATSCSESMQLIAASAGLSREAGETERRAALGTSWSRARKTSEMLGGVKLSDWTSNSLISCFSPQEATALLSAVYQDNAARKKLISELSWNGNQH